MFLFDDCYFRSFVRSFFSSRSVLRAILIDVATQLFQSDRVCEWLLRFINPSVHLLQSRRKVNLCKFRLGRFFLCFFMSVVTCVFHRIATNTFRCSHNDLIKDTLFRWICLAIVSDTLPFFWCTLLHFFSMTYHYGVMCVWTLYYLRLGTWPDHVLCCTNCCQILTSQLSEVWNGVHFLVVLNRKRTEFWEIKIEIVCCVSNWSTKLMKWPFFLHHTRSMW